MASVYGSVYQKMDRSDSSSSLPATSSPYSSCRCSSKARTQKCVAFVIICLSVIALIAWLSAVLYNRHKSDNNALPLLSPDGTKGDEYSFLADGIAAENDDQETSTTTSAPPAGPGDGGDSWERLQISPNEFGSMPYDDGTVAIYEHSNNNKPSFNGTKRYYYAPIALLNHDSAYSLFNNVTKRAEMHFKIAMWDSGVESSIVRYLGDVLAREPVDRSQVGIIPFDNIFLSCKGLPLEKEWRPYLQRNKELEYVLYCTDAAECDSIAWNMKNSPNQFANLIRMSFSLSAQTTQQKLTNIYIDNIMSGELAAKLDQHFNSSSGEALLTADDTKRLLAQSSTKVRIESFDDFDIPSASSDDILKLLQDLLVTSTTRIKDESDKQWDSVFWNDDNYRPDKTTKTFNEIYSKMDSETQSKMKNEFSNKDCVEFSAEVKAAILGSMSASMKADIERSGMSENEYLNKLFQESKNTAEFDGDKFAPKPMTLSRVNLSKMRDQQQMQQISMRVTYKKAFLQTMINIRPNGDSNSTNVLMDLQAQINDLKSQLNDQSSTCNNKLVDLQTQSDDIKSRLSNENSVVSDLQKRLNDFNSQLGELRPPKPVKGPIPTSCAMYNSMGWRQSGLFLIRSADKIKTVYCDYSKSSHDAGFETVIGYNDIKSMAVYFYVQRKTTFRKWYTPVQFDIERLNVGGAMDLSSGIFTAPSSAQYFFSFSGHSVNGNTHAGLYRNNVIVGDSYGRTQRTTLSMESILNLQKGDKITIKISWGDIYDNAESDYGPYTHFTGMLMEENLHF